MPHMTRWDMDKRGVINSNASFNLAQQCPASCISEITAGCGITIVPC